VDQVVVDEGHGAFRAHKKFILVFLKKVRTRAEGENFYEGENIPGGVKKCHGPKNVGRREVLFSRSGFKFLRDRCICGITVSF
jgi:hypothetical protein